MIKLHNCKIIKHRRFHQHWDIFHSHICDANSSCNFSHLYHRDPDKYDDMDNFRSHICDADNPNNVSHLDHRDPDRYDHHMESYSVDANSHKDGTNLDNDMGGDGCNHCKFDNNYHNEVVGYRRHFPE